MTWGTSSKQCAILCGATGVKRMRRGKRAFDLVISSIGVVILTPIFMIIILLILFSDGAPAFFRQERVGFRGQHFDIWKFRTMVRDAERLGHVLTVGRDPRITRVGRWLRKFKIDELPQLVNVIKGEMSLVGPRPEVPRFAALYSHEQRKVLELMPGVTDPASIAFRDEADLLAGCADPERIYVERIMPEKIQLNLDYAARSGLMADVEIIWRTLKAVYAGKTLDSNEIS